MLLNLMSQLRNRRGRATALGACILVASASFSLLTAAATTSAADARGTVTSNLRPAYDILVRPKGSQTAIERSRRLVRENYVSGIYGGITLAQYEKVEKIPGVQVAAPIAMIGYILQRVRVPVDINSAIASSGAEVLTLTETRTTDRGLTRFPPRHVGYLYVTDNPLKSQQPRFGQSFTVTSNTVFGSKETLSNGRKITVCPSYFEPPEASSPFADYTTYYPFCWSRVSEGARVLTGVQSRRPRAFIDVVFPFLIAAINPDAEQKLVGLGNAVVSGRYLRPSDRVTNKGRGHAAYPVVPLLATTAPFLDDQDEIIINRLPPSAVALMRKGLSPDNLRAALSRVPSTAVKRLTIDAKDAYTELLRKLKVALVPRLSVISLDAYSTAGQTNYRRVGPTQLKPVPVENPVSVWRSDFYAGTGYEPVPIESSDLAFRKLYQRLGSAKEANGGGSYLPGLHAVGEFDPNKLPGFSALSQVPMETYYSPVATGADSASRGALGNRPLLPNANMAGYLQTPPLILTTLGALPAFERGFRGANAAAPISVIRVRLGGLHGSGRDRLNQAANIAAAIKHATGLDVDLTAGSSPTSITIDLPKGRYGRPPLEISEQWVKKGVALVIFRAIDRKSAVLFALILLVSALLVANGTAAAVRARRTEIGILRCIGWRRRTISRWIFGEVILVGLAAGLTGTGLSAVLIVGLGLHLPLSRTLLITPAAIALAALGGFLPAWLAGRGEALDAVRPAILPARRARPVRHLSSLAWSNLRRRPGRAALAALALAVGIAAFTAVLAIDLGFRREIAGSSLGGFITTRTRTVDYLSAALAVALGVASTADVLYLNLRERAPEIAALAATGWQRQHLIRVALYEGASVGIVGSLAGAALGLTVAAAVGAGGLAMLLAALCAIGGGVVLTIAATRVVANVLTRLPLAAALTEE